MDAETRLAEIRSRLQEVQQTSNGYKAECPAHPDRNPSLSIRLGNDGKILLRCFAGCNLRQIMAEIGLPMSILFPGPLSSGISGSSVKFSKVQDSINAEDTARAEAQMKKAVRLYHGGLPLVGSPGGDYLESRGIPAEFAEKNGVRFAPHFPCQVGGKRLYSPAIIFPIYKGTPALQLVAVNARFLHPEFDTFGEKQRTYGKVSFGMFRTNGSAETEEVLIAEAPIDTLTLALVGFPAFAVCGASNIRYFPELMDGKTVICAFDTDKDPSTRERVRTSIRKFQQKHGGRVLWVKPPGGETKDWNDMLQRYGPKNLAVYLRKAGAKCDPPILQSCSVSTG